MDRKLECRVLPSQVAAFRLKRHHLFEREPVDPVTICRDICGVQAQVMGSANLAFCARTDNILRQDIHSVLWTQRALVKTSAMRQTLHLLPANDYHMYKTALKASRMAALMGVMARIGVGQKEVDAMNAALLDLLGADPVPQRILVEAIKPRIKKISKKLDLWMKLSWSVFRPAIVAGLVCYGPPHGNEATLVRVDRWLPKPKSLEEGEAKQILLRGYLSAYGPATIQDFSRWSGISMKEVKPVWESLQQEMAEVSLEGTEAFILRKHLPELVVSKFTSRVVRLLPGFDPYLLAHAAKDHLVHPRDYKRVYRNQGWISPVILLDGRVVGIWRSERKGRRAAVVSELFEKLPKSVLEAIEVESKRVLCFSGAEALNG